MNAPENPKMESWRDAEMKRIYVHGLGQSPESWEKVLARCSEAEDSVCPDLAELIRGKDASYENLYAAFSGFCNQYERPVGLCGLSLGGVLALHYAIDHPERVRSLALLAAQYKMPRNLLRLQNFIFHFMPKSAFQQTGFQKADFLLLCKSMMELDFSASLKKIFCPTLIVCGERDSANRKSAVKLASLLDHAELRMLHGAGHELNVEAPEQLAEVLCRFFSEKHAFSQKNT